MNSRYQLNSAIRHSAKREAICVQLKIHGFVLLTYTNGFLYDSFTEAFAPDSLPPVPIKMIPFGP